MIKNITYSIVFLCVGILLGWLGHCVHTKRETSLSANTRQNEIVVNNTIRDTVLVPIEIPITKVRTRYLTITDTLVRHLTDSVLIETIKENPMSIPANDYQDTVETDEYIFSYFIGTTGELMIFNPEIKCKPTVRIIEPVQKNWSVSVGLSNKLTCKLGAGYKGWQLEADLSPKSVNKVYFTKQFNF
jgi:hypothetical protein